MNEVPLAAKEGALQIGAWSRLRALCMGLTLGGALLLGLPLFLSAVAQRPPLPLEAEAPSLDPWLSLAVLCQLLLCAAFLVAHRFWRRWAPRRPAPGEAWDAAGLADAWSRAWALRYALAASVCLVASGGLFLGYLDGLLPAATRFAVLTILPLGALAWMLRHWPDPSILHDAFFNS